MTVIAGVGSDELLSIEREGVATLVRVHCPAIRELQIALLSGRLEELSDLAEGRLGLGLSAVRGMSCGFLESLVRLSRRAEAAGGQLVVFELSREVRDLLGATGLDAALMLAREREEALAILTQMGPDRHGSPARGEPRGAGLSLRRLFGRAA